MPGPLLRFRDVGDVTIISGSFCDAGTSLTRLGCVNSITIALGSDVLRGRCGAAISERYQGLTNLSAEITIETNNPFINLHPGDEITFSFQVPEALFGVPTPGIVITVFKAVVTTHSGRVEKDSLGSGTYVLRAVSPDGITCPISIADDTGTSVGSDAAPGDFIRDVADFTFSDASGGLVLSSVNFCIRSFEFSENSELLEDSCQGALWPEYVGISGLNTTVSVTGRGIKTAFEELGVDAASLGSVLGGSTCLGRKGTITFSALFGSDESCVGAEAGAPCEVRNVNVNEVNFTFTSGEIAEATVSWTGHGEAGEVDDCDKRAIVVCSSTGTPITP